MLTLAIILFFAAPVFLYFAFHPNQAFYAEEGWKFKDRHEPSERYAAANAVYCVMMAVASVCVGIWIISIDHRDNVAAEQRKAIAESNARCVRDIEPRFRQTVRWHGHQLGNPDKVKELAKELGVDVKIDRSSSTGTVSDDVVVSDPKRPGDTTLFILDGILWEHQEAGTQVGCRRT
ncbi:hypothetical protein A5634_03050 [Mycobacterium asiaticum]|uniref:DUF6199 domain-containing protein n=1 Tax=Mycobacterium asiaticum TaxID=1790 RepID=A0A1A3NTG1_MYCAS|nr:hypothetical protein [Mycobacterium asiaticum]OBK24329.1 hypothetical protein A5634_03050 [Mycobacterium asiaticum]